MQYTHTHREDYSLPGTLALTATTKDHLHQMFTTHSTQLMMMLGLSIASPNDQFEKRVGREFASKRTLPVAATFKHFAIDHTKHVYSFEATMRVGFKDYAVLFDLTTVAESTGVKLVSAQILEK